MTKETLADTATQEEKKSSTVTLVSRDTDGVSYMPVRICLLKQIARLVKVLETQGNHHIAEAVVNACMALLLRRKLVHSSLTEESMHQLAVLAVQNAVDRGAGQLRAAMSADNIVKWFTKRLQFDFQAALKFLEASFDTIPDAELSQCHGVLSKGGFVVLYVPMKPRKLNVYKQSTLQDHMTSVMSKPVRGTYLNYG